MKKSVICTITFVMTAIVSWFLLSYFFFPIKLSAPANEYFIATMSSMAAFKFIITLIFCLGASFIADMKIEKKMKMNRDDFENE